MVDPSGDQTPVDHRPNFIHHRKVVRAKILVDDQLREVTCHIREEHVKNGMCSRSAQPGVRVRAQVGLFAFLHILLEISSILVAASVSPRLESCTQTSSHELHPPPSELGEILFQSRR